MKLTVLHKILSTLLAVFVLVSTLSFTVEKHFCGEHLVDTAIFSNAKKCGGMDAEDISYVKKPCCKDTVDVIEGQDDLTEKDFQSFEKDTYITLVSYVFSYTYLFETLAKPIIPHKNYKPPKIIKDIHVLDETYLI
ncbi:HYC_CC_PP family protein [Winogradskyella alexanderae]|uniref:Secreted protein n=1 Tax=Winogradskyella alexanderae TaxID=2877123 RepID=A0ABS7XVY2_9FLAO|nr:hypothetical protein [Winogradskyella alexanderae]MCA0132986.1 hypothetical protein [Winogradskyella alexanderae]